MSRKIVNVLFFVFILLLVTAIAFEKDIREFIDEANTFNLFEIPLTNIASQKTKIQEGYQGYVVFYGDLTVCSLCLLKLGDVSSLSQVYDEIGFFAILRGRESPQKFAELMGQNQMPGEYLVDPQRQIQIGLGLSDHAMLMFFDKNSRLVAGLPLDVDHENLLKQYHRYVNEL